MKKKAKSTVLLINFKLLIKYIIKKEDLSEEKLSIIKNDSSELSNIFDEYKVYFFYTFILKI